LIIQTAVSHIMFAFSHTFQTHLLIHESLPVTVFRGAGFGHLNAVVPWNK